MILRVLDHYNDFHCIADKCRDSCCIGWEIDIDEDTYAYYQSVPGQLGRRLKENMYRTEEGDYSFRLADHGRCPFLNQRNLCDICAELGEEAFSEVCTEYPRFSVYYGDVLQKTLALSCEEVGRLVFTNPEPMKIVDLEVPSEEDYYEDDDENFEEDFTEDPRTVSLLESAQTKIISLLQNRKKTLEERLQDALTYGHLVQLELNGSDEDEISEEKAAPTHLKIDLSASQDRFSIFEQMETLDTEWETEKEKLRAFYGQDYETGLQAFLDSPDYRETDFEHLLVYFIFRYGMTAVLDNNYDTKLHMALEFTQVLRDMAAQRFAENDGHFMAEDMIDIARIFSKEVEHSEENVAFAEEEFFFLSKAMLDE